MIKCTYYKNTENISKFENSEVDVEEFLNLLKLNETGDVIITKAVIGNFELDCNKLSQSLKL